MVGKSYKRKISFKKHKSVRFWYFNHLLLSGKGHVKECLNYNIWETREKWNNSLQILIIFSCVACAAYNIFDGNLIAVKVNKNKRYTYQFSQSGSWPKEKVCLTSILFLLLAKTNLWNAVFLPHNLTHHHYWGSQVRNSSNCCHHIHSKDHTKVNDPCCLIVCSVHPHKIFSALTDSRAYTPWNSSTKTWLPLPTLIKNQDNLSKTCSLANLIYTIYSIASAFIGEWRL